jgi:hypothetical protein
MRSIDCEYPLPNNLYLPLFTTKYPTILYQSAPTHPLTNPLRRTEASPHTAPLSPPKPASDAPLHIITGTVLLLLAPHHPASEQRIPQPHLLHITMDKTPTDLLHLPYFGHTARIPPNLNSPLQNPTRHQAPPCLMRSEIARLCLTIPPPTPTRPRTYTCTSFPQCLVSPLSSLLPRRLVSLSSSLLPQSQSPILTIACLLQRGKAYFPCFRDMFCVWMDQRRGEGGRGA